MNAYNLRVRNLATGEMLIATFEHEEDVAAYLIERPEMFEVIGLRTNFEDPAVHARLKPLIRPLNDEERARMAVLDAQDALARAEAQAAEARRAKAEVEAHKERMRTADPNRPMKVTWARGGGFAMLDPADTRAISAEAQEAVLAWVAERNTWVESRGQEVEEAVVEVWPGPMPRDGERVLPGGRFTPAAKLAVGEA